MSDTDRVIADMHRAVTRGDNQALNAASEAYLRSPTGQALGQQVQQDTQTLQEQLARTAQPQAAQQQGAAPPAQGTSR